MSPLAASSSLYPPHHPFLAALSAADPMDRPSKRAKTSQAASAAAAEPRRSWGAVPGLRHAERTSLGPRAHKVVGRANGGNEDACAPPLPSASCHIDRLPDELVATILRVVYKKAQSLTDIMSLLLTCRRFYDICRPASHWSLLASASVESLLPTDAARWTSAVQRFLLSAAAEGNIEAIYIAGMISFYCIGNHWAGARLLAQAAECGHGPATYSLAIINFHGSGGTARDTNPQAGVDLCWRAAKLGFMPALQELGHCFVDGYGVSQRVSLGKLLLQHAAAAMEAGSSSCRCGSCPLSPSSPSPRPFALPCATAAPPHSPAAASPAPSAAVAAAPPTSAVAQAVATGTQAAAESATEARGAAAAEQGTLAAAGIEESATAAAAAPEGVTGTQQSGKKALEAWKSRRFGRSSSWPPSGEKSSKVVHRRSGAPISAAANVGAPCNTYLSAGLEEEGSEMVQRGNNGMWLRETRLGSVEEEAGNQHHGYSQGTVQLQSVGGIRQHQGLSQLVLSLLESQQQQREAIENDEQQHDRLQPPQQQQQQQQEQRLQNLGLDLNREVEPVVDGRQGTASGWREPSQPSLNLTLAPPRDTLYELFGGEKPQGWSVLESSEEEEEEGEDAGEEEGEEEVEEDLECGEEEDEKKGTQEALSRDQDPRLSHRQHPQPQHLPPNATLHGSNAHLTQLLLSSLLTYTHSHTHCPLSLQLAFPRPSAPHRIHSFLATWHAIRPLPSGRRCCGSPACGRPETRVGEFRTCVRCGRAKYCSRSCQVADWKFRHSFICCPE
ncbi:hypothetical protein CLOM_g23213 [Closterium sp. NIES-68]|nr:hypothetical protein CLOM_g23213 [Closterium sp. NIES-68]GJP74605.1 hypothetical protein CLOP_g5165 [Closterium sp. NIES-67]